MHVEKGAAVLKKEALLCVSHHKLRCSRCNSRTKQKSFWDVFRATYHNSPVDFVCASLCAREGGGASDDQSLEQSVLSRYNGFCELEGSAIQFIYKP